MSRKMMVHNGVEMAKGWPDRIAEAQHQSTYLIGGKLYDRIPYGAEKDDWGADERPCHDCAVVKGQLHVQGCDVERCPRCDGQVISCDCPYDLEESSSLSKARSVVSKFLEQQAERQFKKIESQMFKVLRAAWKRLARKAFTEIGKHKLTGEQVRKYLLQHFDVDGKGNRAVKDLWQELSIDERMALLEEVFQEKTYSRRSKE